MRTSYLISVTFIFSFLFHFSVFSQGTSGEGKYEYYGEIDFGNKINGKVFSDQSKQVFVEKYDSSHNLISKHVLDLNLDYGDKVLYSIQNGKVILLYIEDDRHYAAIPQNAGAGGTAYPVIDHIFVTIDNNCNILTKLNNKQSSKLAGAIYPLTNGSGFCEFRYNGIVKLNNYLAEDTITGFDPSDKEYSLSNFGSFLHDGMLTYIVVSGGRGLYALNSHKIITLNLNTFQFEKSILTKSYIRHEISSFFEEQGFIYFFFVEYTGIGSWKNYHIQNLNLYKLDKHGNLLKEAHEPATPEFEKMFFENKKITGYFKNISIYNDNVIISGETPRKINKKFIIKLTTDLKLVSAYSYDK